MADRVRFLRGFLTRCLAIGIVLAATSVPELAADTADPDIVLEQLTSHTRTFAAADPDIYTDQMASNLDREFTEESEAARIGSLIFQGYRDEEAAGGLLADYARIQGWIAALLQLRGLVWMP